MSIKPACLNNKALDGKRENCTYDNIENVLTETNLSSPLTRKEIVKAIRKAKTFGRVSVSKGLKGGSKCAQEQTAV